MKPLPYNWAFLKTLLPSPDPDGHVYQSLVSMRGPPALPPGGAAPLPRTQLLGLHVGGALLEAASAIYLDDCHVAVVGAPHPAAGPGTSKHSSVPHTIEQLYIHYMTLQL